MVVAMAAATLAALSAGRFVLEIRNDPKHEGISMLETIGAAAEGRTMEAFGNFRLGGLTPGKVPLFVECTTHEGASEAFEHGADGLVLSDLDLDMVRAITALRADRSCQIVVLEPVTSTKSSASIAARVRALMDAGADIVRFTHHAASGPSDLESLVKELRSA
jgi:hypothetical protein